MILPRNRLRVLPLHKQIKRTRRKAESLPASQHRVKKSPQEKKSGAKKTCSETRGVNKRRQKNDTTQTWLQADDYAPALVAEYQHHSSNNFQTAATTGLSSTSAVIAIFPARSAGPTARFSFSGSSSPLRTRWKLFKTREPAARQTAPLNVGWWYHREMLLLVAGPEV